MYQFNFSENHSRKTNRNMLIGISFLFICALGFALFISDFDVIVALPAVGVPCLIMASIYTIEILLLNRSNRKMKVFIYEDKIIKQCGKHHQTVFWDNIVKVKLNESQEGSDVWIRLYQKNERVIYLSGFDEMDNMARLIREKISDKVLVQTKRYKLDPGSPIVLMITCIVTIVVIGSIAYCGPKVLNIFATLFGLIVGSVLLIFRPLTKSDINFKWLEIIMALFMILLCIYGFIVFFMTGKFP